MVWLEFLDWLARTRACAKENLSPIQYRLAFMSLVQQRAFSAQELLQSISDPGVNAKVQDTSAFFYHAGTVLRRNNFGNHHLA